MSSTFQRGQHRNFSATSTPVRSNVHASIHHLRQSAPRDSVSLNYLWHHLLPTSKAFFTGQFSLGSRDTSFFKETLNVLQQGIDLFQKLKNYTVAGKFFEAVLSRIEGTKAIQKITHEQLEIADDRNKLDSTLAHRTYIWLGLSKARLGNYAEAHILLAENYPGHAKEYPMTDEWAPGIQYEMGIVAVALNRLEDALEHFRLADEHCKFLESRRSRVSPDEKWCIAIWQSRCYYHMKNFSEAESTIRIAIDKATGKLTSNSPHLAHARTILGLVKYEMGRHEEAVGRYEEAMERYDEANTTLDNIHRNISSGDLLLSSQNPLRLDYIRGLICSKLGDYDRAGRAFSAALKSDLDVLRCMRAKTLAPALTAHLKCMREHVCLVIQYLVRNDYLQRKQNPPSINVWGAIDLPEDKPYFYATYYETLLDTQITRATYVKNKDPVRAWRILSSNLSDYYRASTELSFPLSAAVVELAERLLEDVAPDEGTSPATQGPCEVFSLETFDTTITEESGSATMTNDLPVRTIPEETIQQTHSNEESMAEQDIFARLATHSISLELVRPGGLAQSGNEDWHNRGRRHQSGRVLNENVGRPINPQEEYRKLRFAAERNARRGR